jgi:hypothetical protein
VKKTGVTQGSPENTSRHIPLDLAKKKDGGASEPLRPLFLQYQCYSGVVRSAGSLRLAARQRQRAFTEQDLGDGEYREVDRVFPTAVRYREHPAIAGARATAASFTAASSALVAPRVTAPMANTRSPTLKPCTLAPTSTTSARSAPGMEGNLTGR